MHQKYNNMSTFSNKYTIEALKKIGNAVEIQFRKDMAVHNVTYQTSKSFKFYVKDEMLFLTFSDVVKYLNVGTRGTTTGLPNRKMPPVSALKNWATKRGVTNVWALAKHIQKYGTKAYHVLDNSERVMKQGMKYLQAGFDKDVKFTMKQLIQEMKLPKTDIKII